MGERYPYDTEYTQQCRKKNNAEYMKRYRLNHPEQTRQHRINSEIRHLESLGYIVKAPRKEPEQMTLEELETIIDQGKTRKREYARKWRESNREHLREYQRQYRKDHPEKTKLSAEKRREYARRWRAKNPEKIRQYQREWYYTHPEQVRQHQQKWRAKNPGYEKLRWARYKKALEQARREQYRKIRKAKEQRKVVSDK